MYILAVTASNSFVVCFLIIVALRRAIQNQEKAYEGDARAAKRIILPCYKPLFRGLAGLYLLLGLWQIVAFFLFYNAKSGRAPVVTTAQHYSLVLLVIYMIPLCILSQASVSRPGFWRVFYILSFYFIFCLAMWLAYYFSPKGSHELAPYILYCCLTFLVPVAYAIGLLTRKIKSRIQLRSRSNRGCIELVLLFSLVYLVFNIAVYNASEGESSILVVVLTFLMFILNLSFPLSLYRCLLADTKFWRGMGRHNKGGIRLNDKILSGDQPAPEIGMDILSRNLQDMIISLGDKVIDFAYLHLEKKLGDGATAEVYMGCYKKRKLAVKISTPPEVTEEVVQEFAKEAQLTSLAHHENIVKFYGICIRPPQIAMVVELCSNGDLKNCLVNNPLTWDMKKKLRACIDGAAALECIHSKKIMHRDVKAVNFFVSDDWVVKLGDFGEATRFRAPDDTKRMNILGTVAYMAPELVNAATYYTEAVDIYAYAVTMWEIWTGGLDPFSEYSTFEIYDLVTKGKRPDLTKFRVATLRTSNSVDSAGTAVTMERSDFKSSVVHPNKRLSEVLKDDKYLVPDGVLELMQAGWVQNPESRLSATELVNGLVAVYINFLNDSGNETGAAKWTKKLNLRKKMIGSPEFSRDRDNSKNSNSTLPGLLSFHDDDDDDDDDDSTLLDTLRGSSVFSFIADMTTNLRASLQVKIGGSFMRRAPEPGVESRPSEVVPESSMKTELPFESNNDVESSDGDNVINPMSEV